MKCDIHEKDEQTAARYLGGLTQLSKTNTEDRRLSRKKLNMDIFVKITTS